MPDFDESYQRFYLALNDHEFNEINKLRDRRFRCVAIAFLGYF
ncbi:MAG: hypothetical protein KZQ84_19085 [Candidatus Thiodiazotropha sp. (ex Lucinoma borealis)]|nr:hypothetical protein [Candidatus Thiodiazotropha sp. (ex Lucinoma borealis)]